MQNCSKCVVMETRYIVDTTSQELPIKLKKRHFWSSPTPLLYFFPQKMITAQVTLPIFLQTCVFLTVWEVFVFFKPWLALCEVDFCYCDIVVVYPWLTIRIITDGHEFKFWLVSVFFPFHLLFFLLFVVVFFYFSLFLLFVMPLKLIKLQTQKNVGLVIIQRVVRRCSIEGRQKTVSNSFLSISEM